MDYFNFPTIPRSFFEYLRNTKKIKLIQSGLRYFSVVVFSMYFIACTTPVTPEFELKAGLIFIEGFASTAPGASFVTINESAIEFGFYAVNSLNGAEVSFENLETKCKGARR